MQRSHQYLILSLFLFFAMLSFLFSFDIYLQGSQFDRKQIEILTTKLEQFKLQQQYDPKLNNPSHNNSHEIRSLASISANLSMASVDQHAQTNLNLKTKLESSLNSETPVKMNEEKTQQSLVKYYFLRSEELGRKGAVKEAFNYLKKIKQVSGNENELAQADYLYLELKCSHKSKLDETCVGLVDKMVDRYPYSEWTGLSLNWLSKMYKKEKKWIEYSSLQTVLKEDFIVFPRVQKQLQQETIAPKSSF